MKFHHNVMLSVLILGGCERIGTFWHNIPRVYFVWGFVNWDIFQNCFCSSCLYNSPFCYFYYIILPIRISYKMRNQKSFSCADELCQIKTVAHPRMTRYFKQHCLWFMINERTVISRSSLEIHWKNYCNVGFHMKCICWLSKLFR